MLPLTNDQVVKSKWYKCDELNGGKGGIEDLNIYSGSTWLFYGEINEEFYEYIQIYAYSGEIDLISIHGSTLFGNVKIWEGQL